jgi:hypothetical protein
VAPKRDVVRIEIDGIGTLSLSRKLDQAPLTHSKALCLRPQAALPFRVKTGEVIAKPSQTGINASKCAELRDHKNPENSSFSEKRHKKTALRNQNSPIFLSFPLFRD